MSFDGKPDGPGVVRHDTPCDRCAAAAVACWGIPGRVCERCKLASQRCTKSSGRGGRGKRKRDADGDGGGDGLLIRPLDVSASVFVSG
jgi:hypothetical protein